MKQRTEYETIDGKWWLFVNDKPVRELTDNEAAQVIWGKDSIIEGIKKMNKRLFKFVHAISNWFYILYFKVLGKIWIRKLLKMDVVQRKNFLLSRGFMMVEYGEIDKSNGRVYKHKSGIRIIDRSKRYSCFDL